MVIKVLVVKTCIAKLKAPPENGGTDSQPKGLVKPSENTMIVKHNLAS